MDSNHCLKKVFKNLHKILGIMMIHVLLSQNFIVKTDALFILLAEKQNPLVHFLMYAGGVRTLSYDITVSVMNNCSDIL